MKSDKTKGYFMILIAGILWGSIGFFVSILNSLGADSYCIAFLRIGVGAVLLVPIMILSGGLKLFKIDRRGLIAALVLGLFSQALFNFSYNEAISNVGVATASVLLYTSPVFVCIMSRIFFKENIGPVKYLALAINIVGSVFTVTGGDFSTINFSVYGVIAGVSAGFLYGLMTIVSSTTDKYHPLTILFYSFLFGSIALAVVVRPWETLSGVADVRFVLAAIGYGLIPTVGSYFFYMHGLAKKLETSKVPVIASIETVVAAFIGIIVFNESAGLWKILGICCVILSISIMNLSTDKSAEK